MAQICAYGADGSISVFSQLDTATNILTPIEEITKDISADSIRGLSKVLAG